MPAAGRAVGAALEPVHDVLQVPPVAAALAPHKQAFDHVVAHGAHAGTLVAPGGRERGFNVRAVIFRQEEEEEDAGPKATHGERLRSGLSSSYS